MNILKIIKNIAVLRAKMPLIGSVFAGVVIAICLLGIAIPETSKADLDAPIASYVANVTNESAKKDANPTIASKATAAASKAVKAILQKVVVTAYSSTVDQTDDTPLVTASGRLVADGVAANNGLPFGTKFKIPSLYGDKIFVVQDRMNRRYDNDHFDIWMASTDSALKFGVKTAEIHILEN